MRTLSVLFVFVGLTYASITPAWKENTKYVYFVHGRTLTSLNDLSDQYSGIFLKAYLHINLRPDGKLQGKVVDAQYAQIHTKLPDGWNTYIPESQLSYKPLGLSDKQFHIVSKDGLFKSIIVEKEVTNWEANIIKSIVSQFQLDIKGQNALDSSLNDFPTNEKFNGVFKSVEESVTGKTEILYDIHPLPEYLVQSMPWMVPHYQLKEEGQVIEVIKNKNYANSMEKPVYHYGFGELSQGRPASNKMGEFFIRQSNSRVILTGKVSSFTIQNVQTFNKIIVNPTITGKEQGSVVSILNATLHDINYQMEEIYDLVNPIDIGNLVYSYETPFAKSNKVYQKQYEEESMQHQTIPEIGQASNSPLLPYNMGYYGESIKANKDFDLKENVELLAKDISGDMPEPEQVLVRSTLSKYVMLTSLVRLMDEEEINYVAQQLYTTSQSKLERTAWMTFRDAVAEAGTGPAFLTIKKWIESHKVEKAEASEVVASMAYNVRVPTEEYMRQFFEMIKSPEISRQEYLNESALLSYTRLFNKVYVNREASFNQYPAYSFGKFSVHKDVLESAVLSYLTQNLDEAVDQADSNKIHIYIRALGNVGHKRILETFEPYLEGRKTVSQFQRMLMVLSLDKLVESDPINARAVLYKIYQNSGEMPEVRVVAVYQLMRTVPPYEMIQQMAENTNTDPQEEVNAVVKFAIESASKLRTPESQTLRKSAESAKPFLTKKEYGNQQSLNFLKDFVLENMNIKYKQNYFQVGSEDHIFPKGMKYTMRENSNGMKHYVFSTQAMISSIKELTNLFYQQIDREQIYKNQKYQQESENSEYSSANIAKILNLKVSEREQLEGFIYNEMASFQELWSFDNETINRLPQVIYEKEQMLKNGKEFNYTKLKHLRAMALSFPTELGLPFVYTYDLPLLIQFEGRVKAILNPSMSKNDKLYMPGHIFGEIEAHVTITTKLQSHLSVVTPFDHQVYTAGVDKNFQAHLPLVGQIDVDLNENYVHAKVVLEVKEIHNNARLLHFSSWPYTSRSDVMSLSPMALRPNTHRIRLTSTHKHFDFALGQKQTGVYLRIWGHHPNRFNNVIQLMDLMKPEGSFAIFQHLWDESSLQQTETSIALIPNQSSTQKIYMNFRYTTQFKQKPKQESTEDFYTLDQLFTNTQKDAQKRQQDMMNHVGAGITDAQLYSFDASVTFKGDEKYEHLFSFAAARSNVDAQSSFVSFYNNNAKRPTSIALQVKGYVSNTNELDVTYVLNNAPKSKYEALLQYGHNEQQSSRVRATVNLGRSEARKRFLEEHPLYQICKNQMQNGDYQLYACQNMTIESKYLDDINIDIYHENFRKGCLDAIVNMFNGIRFWYQPMSNVTNIQAESKNNIKLKIQFEPESLKRVNVTIRANEEETKITNLFTPKFFQTIFVSDPLFPLKSRLVDLLYGQENLKRTCLIGNKSAQTFSNSTYPLSLENKWTLMMMYIPQESQSNGTSLQQAEERLRNQQENIAVLVREITAGHKELKVVLNTPQTEGRHIEIAIKPKKLGSVPEASVWIDNKEISYDDKHAAKLFKGFIEIYALPNEEVKMEIKNWFYVVYDSKTLKLDATSDSLRDSIVGLCGRYSNDIYEDFWTPHNCIVRSPENFCQSFIVEERQRNPQPEEQFQECIPKVLPIYANVISNNDIEKREIQKQKTPTNTRLRHRYVEQNGEICFTIHPVPVCKRFVRFSINKNVPVYCIAKTKTAYSYMKQIDQGINPDFSQNPVTKTIELEIPQNCI